MPAVRLFRPNSMGLSCVRLLGVEYREDLGPVLRVAGADLMDGTPIFDIKPYVPLADCRPEAVGGFSDRFGSYHLRVEMEERWKEKVPPEKLDALLGVLGQDPQAFSTRKIRNGYTAWNLPGWKSNFG